MKQITITLEDEGDNTEWSVQGSAGMTLLERMGIISMALRIVQDDYLAMSAKDKAVGGQDENV